MDNMDINNKQRMLSMLNVTVTDHRPSGFRCRQRKFCNKIVKFSVMEIKMSLIDSHLTHQTHQQSGPEDMIVECRKIDG